MSDTVLPVQRSRANSSPSEDHKSRCCVAARPRACSGTLQQCATGHIPRDTVQTNRVTTDSLVPERPTYNNFTIIRPYIQTKSSPKPTPNSVASQPSHHTRNESSVSDFAYPTYARTRVRSLDQNFTFRPASSTTGNNVEQVSGGHTRNEQSFDSTQSTVVNTTRNSSIAHAPPNHELNKWEQLQNIVAASPPGANIRIEVYTSSRKPNGNPSSEGQTRRPIWKHDDADGRTVCYVDRHSEIRQVRVRKQTPSWKEAPGEFLLDQIRKVTHVVFSRICTSVEDFLHDASDSIQRLLLAVLISFLVFVWALCHRIYQVCVLLFYIFGATMGVYIANWIVKVVISPFLEYWFPFANRTSQLEATIG
jgi:hypothetical protein